MSAGVLSTSDNAAGPSRVRLGLLDGFRLEVDGVEPVLPPNAQRIVAYLGLGSRCSRDAVAGHLWPDVSERHAQGSLRSAVWRLERTCPGLVRSSHRRICLAPGTRVDAQELETWARSVLDPAGRAGDGRAPDYAFRGELLPGWYDDWVLLEREHLHQLRLHALESLARALATERRFGEALEAAHGALRCEPLRESILRVIVRIHLAEGNVVDALRHYERFAGLLRRELGIEPSEQLCRLVESVRPPRSTVCELAAPGADRLRSGRSWPGPT